MKRPPGGQSGPDLFAAQAERRRREQAPLAERMRPQSLGEIVGQQHLIAPGRLVERMVAGGQLHSLILWGPPGTGKTTLASVIARSTDATFVQFSAVLSGVKDLRDALAAAEDRLAHHGRQTVLFVDEIHRFNKAQQDAFLPHVENGTIVLIGATTENPSFEVIAPLLSRASVLTLGALQPDDIAALLDRALADGERGLGAQALQLDTPARAFLAERAHGDARFALNLLESAANFAVTRGATVLDLSIVEEAVQQRALRYDKSGDEHHNVVSAFIKSMRGSDPDAALYWLARMIEAGEDALFIARRMVIFASEDIGTADPHALPLAIAARDAVHFVGMPEGRIPLAHAAAYLASAPKSNAAYRAIGLALDDVRQHGPLPVPLHLRNAPTRMMKDMGYGSGYRYAHDFAGNVVDQQHLPDALRERRYYEPTDNGAEAAIRERLQRRGQREP
jgi:putative ATPase